jgi:hypothetical protein
MILQKLAAMILAAATVIPFELINRHIVIDAAVDGSPALSFVLDTGDQTGIIDLDRARQLGLTLGRQIKIGGVGSGAVTGYLLNGATFVLPALADAPQRLAVALPLADLATRLGHPFDGIIGADFIRQFVVEIDYTRRTITLHDPTAFTYEGNGESMPVRFTVSGHPLIDAVVTPLEGPPIPGTFLIDIGSGGGVALHSPFARAHHLPAPADKTIRAMGLSGAGGEGTGRLGRFASVTIGRVSLARPLALFSQDAAGAFADAAISGNIGYEILRRFRLFLDYSHQRIIFEPAAGFDAPFNRPMTGFTFATGVNEFHSFTVTGVLDGSPASEAGLESGDVILAVDDRPAADLTLTAILDLFEQPLRRVLTVRRGGVTRTLALTPRVLVE